MNRLWGFPRDGSSRAHSISHSPIEPASQPVLFTPTFSTSSQPQAELCLNHFLNPNLKLPNHPANLIPPAIPTTHHPTTHPTSPPPPIPHPSPSPPAPQPNAPRPTPSASQGLERRVEEASEAQRRLAELRQEPMACTRGVVPRVRVQARRLFCFFFFPRGVF